MRKRSRTVDKATLPPYETRPHSGPLPLRPVPPMPQSAPLPPLPPLTAPLPVPAEYTLWCAGTVHERQPPTDWPQVRAVSRAQAEQQAMQQGWNRNPDGDYFCAVCAHDTTPVLVYKLQLHQAAPVIFTDIAGVVDEIREQLADAEIADDAERAITIRTARMLRWQVNMMPEHQGY